MGILRKGLLFCAGGISYMGLELLWRRRTHSSMFFAGGLCFCIAGRLRDLRLPPLWKGLLGSGAITGVELLFGLTVNRDYGVWDYRRFPGNFRGQICPQYTVLWVPVSLFAMGLYDLLNSSLNRICMGGS